MSTWHTISSVRSEWADAEQISDPTLTELLAVAQSQVLAFAPALPADQPLNTIPDSWRLAQKMQARNLFNASAVDSSGTVGDGQTYAVQARPLDWIVKQLLRPKRGTYVVG